MLGFDFLGMRLCLFGASEPVIQSSPDIARVPETVAPALGSTQSRMLIARCLLEEVTWEILPWTSCIRVVLAWMFTRRRSWLVYGSWKPEESFGQRLVALT